ncbi:MAG: hypothetical protein FJW40_20800 [Acidobacteria bacterium]|nr:hypothetical protein [Acidobacteriota bacterium]
MWNHVEKRLAEYVDGRLPAAEAARVASHLEHCARCRGRCEAVRFNARLLAELPGAAAPSGLWAAIERSLPEPRSSPGFMPMLRWSAIVGMLAVGALGFTRTVPAPEPAMGTCGSPSGKARYRCEVARVSWPARDGRAAVVPAAAANVAACGHCHRN